MRKKIMIFATAMLTLLSASTVFAESSAETTKSMHHYGPGY